MASLSDALPNDIEGLRAFALAVMAERDAAIAEREQVSELNARLRQLLRKAQGFEAKSERLARLDADQLSLALEDLEQAIAKAEAIEEKPSATVPNGKRRINRGALPAHLPRIHETLAPADTNCPCCQVPMHVIGEDTCERLDVVPEQYRVIVTHRPKLACRACERIVEVPAPEHLIKAGLTRKNALFAGHDDGAENWAILASLIECCKLNGIDAQAYLADVLTKLVNLWPNSRLDDLLPWAWASAHKPTQLAA